MARESPNVKVKIDSRARGTHLKDRVMDTRGIIGYKKCPRGVRSSHSE